MALSSRDIAGGAGATIALSFAAVTPSDTVAISGGPARALYVGTAGNVVAVTSDGVAVTFTGVQGGSILPIYCLRVNSTSTTASNIVALF